MTTNRQVLIKAFNRLFVEFLTDLIEIWPDNTDIKQAKQYLNIMKGLNPAISVQLWYDYYSKYKTTIDDGDIFEYAVNKDYTEDLEGVEGGHHILEVFERLKKPISEMSDHNKEMSVDYVRKMSKLACMYQCLV